MMGTYYTFRLLDNAPTLECAKWNEWNVVPETYKVQPHLDYCTCAAMKRDCKHVRLAKAIIDPEFINEMHSWRWSEETGWVETNDIPIKEFADALLAR